MHARRGPRWPVMLAAALCTVWVAQPVAAHLMEDQQGTLNIVGQRGYLVLSLPVSAISGADEDGDGLLSGAELQRRAPAIDEHPAAGRLVEPGDDLDEGRLATAGGAGDGDELARGDA